LVIGTLCERGISAFMLGESDQSELDVFIHVDDTGASRSVTDHHLFLLKEGKVKSLSVLPTGSAVDYFSSKIDTLSVKDFDLWVHLDLVEGFAISNSNLSMITDRTGRFRMSFFKILVSIYFTKASDRREFLYQVEAEWRSQIEFLAEKVKPRFLEGIDSHMHVHVIPPLFEIAVRLKKEFGLSHIRIPKEYFFISNWKDFFSFGYLKGLAKACVVRLCLRQSESTPDSHLFVGLIYSGSMTMKSALKSINKAHIESKKSALNMSRRIMVVFHPGKALSHERNVWGRSFLRRWYLHQNRDDESRELSSLFDFLKKTGGHRSEC
jgi:predicted glycoside hydrolase/deacetylase ChbG (UPF0249 family)